MDAFLNAFFFVFHTSLILFNSFGWAWKRTRKWNLVTLLATAFSWFVIGAWYGWGYCFCTDWHWQVRERLGLPVESNSYNHFLLQKITGLNLDERAVDVLTAVVFFASLVLSIALNIRDRKRKRRMSTV